MDYSETHGLHLSKLMLGTAQLGLPYGMANAHGQPSLKESMALLDTARAGGINCFDTARNYGESEKVLGAYFTGRPGHGCTLVTKYRIDPELGTDPAAVERQLITCAEESLQRLGLEQLPVYLAHQADDITLYGDAVPRTLEWLRSRGLVRRLGVSVYSAAQVDAMLEHGLFEAVQLPMNVFDLQFLRGGQLEKLEKAGWMVFVRSIFLQGLFFMPGLPEAFAWVQPWVDKLKHIAAESSISIAQLVLAYVRDLPGITCLVLGAETPHQVRENIGLMAAPELDAPVRQAVTGLSENLPIAKLMRDIIRWTNSRTAWQGK